MAGKNVSQDDLKKIMRLLEEVVSLQIKHMELGFKPEDIADTFAGCYIRLFERALTSRAIKRIPRENFFESPQSNRKVAISYCLKLASELIQSATKMRKNE